MLNSSDPLVPNLNAFIEPATFGIEPSAAELENYVSRLPSVETSFVCAKLNQWFCESMRQNEMIDNHAVVGWLCEQGWATTEDKKRIFERHHDDRSAFLFSRQTLLELLRWLSVWGSTRSKFSHNDTKRQRAFIRSLALANHFSTRNQEAILLALPNDCDNLRDYLPIFRECSMLQPPPIHPVFRLGRFKKLVMEFFVGRHANYREILEEQLSMSIEAYTSSLIYVGLQHHQQGTIPQFNLANDIEYSLDEFCETNRNSETLRHFFQLEGQTLAEMGNHMPSSNSDPSEPISLRCFREKPILLGLDNKATVIDQQFLFERAVSGFVFRLAQSLGDNPISEFGKAFELYAQEKISQYIERLRSRGLDVSYLPPIFARHGGNQVEIADCAIIEGESAILFEMKAVWTPDTAVSGQQYWAEIMWRYGLSFDENGRPRKKGVAQLSQNIKRFCDGQLQLPTESAVLHNVRTIFPVLFIYDPYLTAIGHGRFLANEFSNLLLDTPGEAGPSFDYGGKTIFNLFMIDIDEFEHFENRNNFETLKELLVSYSLRYPDRLVSSGRYLANIDRQDDELPPIVGATKTLVREAFEYFGETTVSSQE